jgi:hypothetical protein
VADRCVADAGPALDPLAFEALEELLPLYLAARAPQLAAV